jgi:hypothetical protein
MTSTWDDSTVAVLTRRWTAGHSAGEIAAELGTTKGAVIAKAHRLGLAKHERKQRWPRRWRVGALADD